MGIYVFNAEFLYEQLVRRRDDDEVEPRLRPRHHSAPGARATACTRTACATAASQLNDGAPYWRDVGTIDAYWEANIELTRVTPALNLYDQAWPIWTYQEQLPPAKFVFDLDGRRGAAIDSMVSGGCIVSGSTVRHSLLFSSVRVHSYCTIEDAVILPEVEVGRGAMRLKRVVIDKGTMHPAEGCAPASIPTRTASASTSPRRASRSSRPTCSARRSITDGTHRPQPRKLTPESPKLTLVLLWHMHQPDFRDQASGEFRHPWVYLHALKDYSDMAAHLEAHPGVRAVVNLVPVLLDQLEDYAQQCASGELRDPLLKALTCEDLDRITASEREHLLDQCFRANHTKMIEPFAPFKRLRDLFEFTQAHGGEAQRYLSGQYFADLVTWYHLVWTGETVRRGHEPVVRLMSQGEGFSYAQRMELFQLIGTVLREVVGRYRALAESGRVELSSTPYYHPIGPLLLDFACAREATPEAPLPEAQCYPGGRSRLGWHLGHAMDSHSRRFGAAPAGIWPAEGAVSMPFARLVAQAGVRWIASGEGVLASRCARASFSKA